MEYGTLTSDVKFEVDDLTQFICDNLSQELVQTLLAQLKIAWQVPFSQSLLRNLTTVLQEY
jgi:hypothetical protein